MKINNRLGLPPFIVEALVASDYTPSKNPNSISTTQLINPPYIKMLREKHEDEIVEDASDRMWSMLGQIGHGIAARAIDKFPKLIVEQRFHKEIEFVNAKGKVQTIEVNGQVDAFDPESGILYDNKFTSSGTLTYSPQGKEEWHEQLNVYAWLLRQHGHTVYGIRVIAWLRDLTEYDKYKYNTPSEDIVMIDIPLWEEDRQLEFILSKLRYHTSPPEPCTFKERWAKKPKYAIIKLGNIKATKLYDDMDEAYARIKDGYKVEYRPGSDPRCERYCNVNIFCDYYKSKEMKK